MRLSNAKCVVTGGASGIGAATVRRFVEEGAEVCILDYDLPAAETLASELGKSVFALELDVRLEPAVQAAAESVYARWEHVDVLVNNAGVFGNGNSKNPLDNIDVNDLTNVLKINTIAPVVCIREAAKRMIKEEKNASKPSKSIIQMSSGSAYLGNANIAYGASKGALNSMTIGLISRLAQENIRINTVSPGLCF